MNRPADFECPWCGPNGVVIDRSLGPYAICDECAPRDTCERPPPADLEREQAIADLRTTLRAFVADFYVKRWPGAQWGKTIIGNALLGALKSFGCDPKEELRRAQEKT